MMHRGKITRQSFQQLHRHRLTHSDFESVPDVCPLSFNLLGQVAKPGSPHSYHSSAVDLTEHRCSNVVFPYMANPVAKDQV